MSAHGPREPLNPESMFSYEGRINECCSGVFSKGGRGPNGLESQLALVVGISCFSMGV